MYRLTLILALAALPSGVLAAEPAAPSAPAPAVKRRLAHVDREALEAPRDPFAPVGRGHAASQPEMGLIGMRLGDLKLTGVMGTPKGDVAIFEHPAGAFFGLAGDKLKDALIDTVDVTNRRVVLVVPDDGILGEKLIQIAVP